MDIPGNICPIQRRSVWVIDDTVDWRVAVFPKISVIACWNEMVTLALVQCARFYLHVNRIASSLAVFRKYHQKIFTMVGTSRKLLNEMSVMLKQCSKCVNAVSAGDCTGCMAILRVYY